MGNTFIVAFQPSFFISHGKPPFEKTYQFSSLKFKKYIRQDLQDYLASGQAGKGTNLIVLRTKPPLSAESG
jgi:hypothetical protein